MTGIHQLLFSSFAPAAELQTIIVNSTQTITIPAGVTKLDRWLVVAGGGGGGGSSGANNGGGNSNPGSNETPAQCGKSYKLGSIY